ncbi:MAG: toxin-antitoxin system HicB family antitoxin [Maritimibacter sp.]|nr:toxin-antitoxin system HicB family antitoxin [Maritimibacter sp.]
MADLLKFAGYLGSYEIEDGVLVGKLEGIRDLVTFEGETPKELQQAFVEAVEDYVAECERAGREAEKPFKGSFNVRVSSGIHRKLYYIARGRRVTLNHVSREAMEEYVRRHAGEGEDVVGSHS